MDARMERGKRRSTCSKFPMNVGLLNACVSLSLSSVKQLLISLAIEFQSWTVDQPHLNLPLSKKQQHLSTKLMNPTTQVRPPSPHLEQLEITDSLKPCALPQSIPPTISTRSPSTLPNPSIFNPSTTTTRPSRHTNSAPKLPISSTRF